MPRHRKPRMPEFNHLEDTGQGQYLHGRYITVEEYAASCGISLATARRRAERWSKPVWEDKLTASIKVGRQWLLRVGD
jgi:hypothetical protein